MRQEPRVARICPVCRDWRRRECRHAVVCFNCFRAGRGAHPAAAEVPVPPVALPSSLSGAHRAVRGERQLAHRRLMLANFERHGGASTTGRSAAGRIAAGSIAAGRDITH